MILKKITSSFSLKIVLQNEQKRLVLKSVKVKTNFFLKNMLIYTK